MLSHEFNVLQFTVSRLVKPIQSCLPIFELTSGPADQLSLARRWYPLNPPLTVPDLCSRFYGSYPSWLAQPGKELV
jgi:hypothetical protein